MWCRNCNIETTHSVCPICNRETEEESPVEIRWCKECKVPIIKALDDINNAVCPLCGQKTKHLSSDLRPVFPQEKALLEILLDKEAGSLQQCSVWAANSRYYIDGKSYPISSAMFKDTEVEQIIKELPKHVEFCDEQFYQKNIELFIKSNNERLNYLKDEAFRFIKKSVEKYDIERVVLSFSGGKDSTATADLVIKALGEPSLVHIFGDTTLEFPYTTEYAQRYRENNPMAIFKVAKNRDQVFYDVCSDIGPPARMLRWCCSMFKTGPITRVLNNMFKNQKILTFYGIRKEESISRSKYNRIEESSASVKIQKQTVASPIFFWKDLDVWLYILGEKVDFNDAYRLGYDRVGCWCCPNNNSRAQFLAKIYMPEQAEKWRNFLVDFAKKIGKPDPEEYVDSGKWKARQGGNGLAAASDVKIKFTNCTAENHAKIYKLVRPFDDGFLNMMVPLGIVSKELGRKLINETIILDVRTQVPIVSIQPFSQDGYDYAVKIKTMNVSDHEEIQRMIGYQVRKFNACRKCLKCESVCKANAISIIGDEYYINPEKCVHCKMCLSNKYLTGGCMMDRYLKTKE